MVFLSRLAFGLFYFLWLICIARLPFKQHSTPGADRSRSMIFRSCQYWLLIGQLVLITLYCRLTFFLFYSQIMIISKGLDVQVSLTATNRPTARSPPCFCEENIHILSMLLWFSSFFSPINSHFFWEKENWKKKTNSYNKCIVTK